MLFNKALAGIKSKIAALGVAGAMNVRVKLGKAIFSESRRKIQYEFNHTKVIINILNSPETTTSDNTNGRNKKKFTPTDKYTKTKQKRINREGKKN